jgi:hypothetical protein
MNPGEPCGICGEPEYEPITPWKSNYHWAEDEHEWAPMNRGVEIPDDEENSG